MPYLKNNKQIIVSQNSSINNYYPGFANISQPYASLSQYTTKLNYSINGTDVFNIACGNPIFESTANYTSANIDVSMYNHIAVLLIGGGGGGRTGGNGYGTNNYGFHGNAGNAGGYGAWAYTDYYLGNTTIITITTGYGGNSSGNTQNNGNQPGGGNGGDSTVNVNGTPSYSFRVSGGSGGSGGYTQGGGQPFVSPNGANGYNSVPNGPPIANISYIGTYNFNNFTGNNEGVPSSQGYSGSGIGAGGYGGSGSNNATGWPGGRGAQGYAKVWGFVV